MRANLVFTGGVDNNDTDTFGRRFFLLNRWGLRTNTMATETAREIIKGWHHGRLSRDAKTRQNAGARNFVTELMARHY